MSHSDGKEARGTSGGPLGAPADEPLEDKAPRAPDAARNDLVVEHWQAPNPSQLRGSSREIWEYESESDGPSRELVLTLIAVVGGLVAALAFMGYMMFRLVSSVP